MNSTTRSLTIGERVRTRREQLGWSQQKLADATGVSKSVISRLETSKRRPDIALLNQVARTLDVDGLELLAGSQDTGHNERARHAFAIALKMSDETLRLWIDIGIRLHTGELPK